MVFGKAVHAFFTRRTKMEQNLGTMGQVVESYSKGVVSAAANANLPATAFGLSLTLQANVSLDAKVLIGYLAAKIGGPVPAEVAAFLETALAVT
jgi:hypothetical protein